MSSTRSFILLSTLFLLVVQASNAASPDFRSMTPNGGQRGSEVTLTLTGTQLDDFEGLVFFSKGFEMKSVEKVETSKVTCKISIAPDVQPGNHLMRIRSKTGLSRGRYFYVGPFPNVEEKEPNNDIEAPQKIGFNQTIEGVVQTEDVDYFQISAKKGQRISLEVEGLRLGYTTFDPYIAVLDKDRFEKVVSDDTMLHRQDGYCSYEVEEDGDYVVMIRDSSYRGGSTSAYRLHVGSFIRPDVVYPAGGKAGSKTKVRFIAAEGVSFEEEVTLPAEPTEKFMLFSSDAAKAAPSGNPFRVSEFENVLEVEPNETRETATPVKAEPIALNGVIEKEGDTDYFKVPLKKGQKLDIQTFAQGIGSPLDSVIVIYDSNGKSLASNDDGGGRRRLDSKSTVSIPADGDYYLRVYDHLNRGGPNFVYRLELTTSSPEVYYASPMVRNNDSHTRQYIAIPRGGRYASLVNITRKNYSADMQFEAKGLPKGVSLLTTVVPKSVSNAPLLFEAAKDAPLGHVVAPVLLKPTDPKQDVVGRMRQEFDVVRSGNVIYYTEFEDELPIAVVDEAPFELDIVKPTAPLVSDGVLDLKVVAKRAEGFTKNIRVYLLWRPPGISALGALDIKEGQTECTFNLAAKTVSEANWNFTVLGEADAGKGIIYNASPFTEVKTEPAFLTAPEIPMVVVEQGKEATMVCKLEHARPFEGEAVARVVGLPDTIPTEPSKITKDTKEVSFKIITNDKSPVGKRGSLFVQVDVPVPGGGVSTHRVAVNSSIRVDAPRKAPEPAKAVVAKNEPKKETPTEKPKVLSRLEQLRMEARGELPK